MTHRADLILRSGTRVMIRVRRTASAWVTTAGVRYGLATGERKGIPSTHRLDTATICRVATLTETTT